MNIKSARPGVVIVTAMIVLAILGVIVAAYLLMVSREHRMTYKSFRTLQALNLAEAGIEKAIWELNYGGGTWSGWDTSGNPYTRTILSSDTDGLSPGDIGISITDPSSAPQVEAIGYVPNMTLPQGRRQVTVMLGKPTLSDGITEPIVAGGSVDVTGSVEIINTEGYAIQYPGSPYTYNKGGSATVSTPETVEASFPTFEVVFGMSEAQMASIATATYTNPANNVPLTPTGITWINGDAKFTRPAWDGEGILIVTGNLEIQGGNFDGVIYVMGELTMRGNPWIKGSILIRTVDITFSAGTPRVEYDSNTIESKAGGALPWQIESGSWQEQ